MTSIMINSFPLQVIEKLAWLEFRDGKILSTRNKGREVFYIPGGKREGSESDAEALVREIREELTVELDPLSLALEGVFVAQAHGKAEGVKVRMICYSGAYEGDLRPSSEVEEIVWLSYHERQQVSPVDQVIFDWLRTQKRIVD